LRTGTHSLPLFPLFMGARSTSWSLAPAVPPALPPPIQQSLPLFLSGWTCRVSWIKPDFPIYVSRSPSFGRCCRILPPYNHLLTRPSFRGNHPPPRLRPPLLSHTLERFLVGFFPPFHPIFLKISAPGVFFPLTACFLCPPFSAVDKVCPGIPREWTTPPIPFSLRARAQRSSCEFLFFFFRFSSLVPGPLNPCGFNCLIWSLSVHVFGP